MNYLPLLLSAAVSFAGAQNGKSLYTANCSACHQATGRGIPGVFPPQAGHFADLLAAGGRTYTIKAVLFGLEGPIQVKGRTYNGVMPGFAQLSDADLAAILNYVATGWGNTFPATEKPYTSVDFKAERAGNQKPTQVYLQRPPGLK